MSPASELPSGTVTFLFTDIEGSTRLLKRLGPERYGALLAQHNEHLRSVLERHEETFALGDQLLASVRAGWLEALNTDVGINRSMPLERR